MRTLLFAGLALGMAAVVAPLAHAQSRPGMTRTVVGDTVIVECWPEAVAAKPRPVARKAKPRTQTAPGAGPRKVARAKRVVKKAPALQTKQVCREIPLKSAAPAQSKVVPAWSSSLGPVNGPVVFEGPQGAEVPTETSGAGGALPVIGGTSVVGGGSIIGGGAVAAIPLVFVAFLHHNGDDHDNPDNPGVTPEPPVPPVIPPTSTVPEPSSLLLLGTGLAGLGQVIRRRKR